MTTIGNGIIRGMTAGAAGTIALNVTSGLDALLRGRPPSRAPEQLVCALAGRAGIAIPGDRTTRQYRIAAAGPLSGTVTGLMVGAVAGGLRAAGFRLPTALGGPLLGAAAMLASDWPLALTGVSDPRRWSGTDWAADVAPHLAYGIAAHRTLVALDGDERVPAARPATLARAAALGAATGSRSTAALTALALTSRRGDRGVIASRSGAQSGKALIACLAAGELAADKLPSVPSRLAAPGIVPRVTLAATAGAGMAARAGELPGPAAAVAAVTALGSAALGVRLRAAAARRLGSDLPGAFVEDALTGAMAWLGTRRS
ncbi:MAG TPA: hypothetical protein VFW50_27955 [Streptosporangiaceae bacterium]|nr:hypothetical protein [Streptosporangiaceae bacterium]